MRATTGDVVHNQFALGEHVEYDEGTHSLVIPCVEADLGPLLSALKGYDLNKIEHNTIVESFMEVQRQAIIRSAFVGNDE